MAQNTKNQLLTDNSPTSYVDETNLNTFLMAPFLAPINSATNRPVVPTQQNNWRTPVFNSPVENSHFSQFGTGTSISASITMSVISPCFVHRICLSLYFRTRSMWSLHWSSEWVQSMNLGWEGLGCLETAVDDWEAESCDGDWEVVMLEMAEIMELFLMYFPMIRSFLYLVSLSICLYWGFHLCLTYLWSPWPFLPWPSPELLLSSQLPLPESSTYAHVFSQLFSFSLYCLSVQFHIFNFVQWFLPHLIKLLFCNLI